jgi:hypothetical protein
VKFLRNKYNGHLFPYNPEHANREYFETVDIPEKIKIMPPDAIINEDDSQDNPQQFYDAKPLPVRRPYKQRKPPVVEEKTDVGLGVTGISPT